jgi:hypothetical protein
MLPSDHTALQDDAQVQQFVQQKITEYWCQWSCPWAGLSLEPNVPRNTPVSIQYIHSRDVMGDTVTYVGPYQKGPLQSVSYQIDRPFSGRQVAQVMPQLTQALGDEHVLTPRDLASLALLSGSRSTQLVAEMAANTLRPSHVKAIHTLSIIDLKAQPHVAIETHDFRFRWIK